ncbi:coatomer subunit gamma-2 [Saccopteryx leptura]|uniref:coatomer subunit gamma-2 n=1 Tax=Saccopteryx leptura TaxID=249018 RepID=UPI00339BFB3F
MIKKFDKKDEESGSGSNPFRHLEKSAVLQEARLFNETPINPRRCLHILTKILYLLNQGEHFGTTEATEAFFAMTRLFQSNDQILRRMCYLTIKEMANISEDVIIVTSSLTKDMTGKEDVYRGPAIRALCRITDGTMLQAIERYMKQAIVDRVSSVSSSALVSSLHMMKISYDVVKRWVNEAQEAASSDNIMVQYHALGVLYHLKKNDRLAVSKMLNKFTKSGLKSQFAYCMLIRIASRLLKENEEGHESPLFDFIESCLRNKHEMVIYEAASAIIHLPNCTARELAPAVSVLQLFCSSPKPALRYAAVRTLNKVAMKHPSAVTACNLDLENLITDSNRSIATLAITTLLKTGSESSVDRLMKQISSFVSEISDEFKGPEIFQSFPARPLTTPALSDRSLQAVLMEVFRAGLSLFPPVTGLALFTKHLSLYPGRGFMLTSRDGEVPAHPNPHPPGNVAPGAGRAPYAPGGTCACAALTAASPLSAVVGTFSCTMKFTVRDCDPDTGVPAEEGYEDEYVLEDLEVTLSDHIQKVLKPNFAAAWEEVGDAFEKEETFALSSTKTLEEAVNNIITFLGMQPCERSDKVPENKNSHSLYLAGVYRGGHDLLVRSRLALADGVTMQVTVRSKEETPVDVILASVG